MRYTTFSSYVDGVVVARRREKDPASGQGHHVADFVTLRNIMILKPVIQEDLRHAIYVADNGGDAGPYCYTSTDLGFQVHTVNLLEDKVKCISKITYSQMTAKMLVDFLRRFSNGSPPSPDRGLCQ
ncbi:hypothetical protein AUP68_14424 [Ilyonectria robusta]